MTYEGRPRSSSSSSPAARRREPWAWRFGDGARLVADCHARRASQRPRPGSEIAAAFHETVAAAAAAACAEAGEPRTVVLSGGSFQNLRLLALDAGVELEEHGFRVLSHRLVPPNDGGISYGQAAVAARTASGGSASARQSEAAAGMGRAGIEPATLRLKVDAGSLARSRERS